MLAKATLRDLRQEYAGTVRLRCGQGKSARLRVGRFGLATTLLNLVNILDFGMDPKIARRRTEHGSGLGIYRWVVERTVSWLHSFRRLRLRTDRHW